MTRHALLGVLDRHDRYFEIFVLLTIVVNCVFLALSNPPEEPE